MPDGNYEMLAKATDTFGNQKVSSPVSISINNQGGDKIAPIVNMSLPVSGENLANTILLSAEASDNFAVSNVQFKLDGNNLYSAVPVAPYKIALDTTTISNGSHSITAIATDTSGNKTTSSSVNINVDNSQKWFSNFSPQRTFYVSASGSGNGLAKTSPMSFSSAATGAQSGDLYWFLAGTYQIGNFAFSKSGTVNSPIVYRAMPSGRVTLVANLTMSAYTWLWGMEVADEHSGLGNSGVVFNVPGVRLINNIFHDGSGVFPGNGGSGQVLYGNIFYTGKETPLIQRGHHVYTQNEYDSYGYKYYVNNMVLDAPKRACNISGSSANDCFGWHAYTQSGFTQGMHLEKNVFADSRMLIGGYGFPNSRHIVKNNYFYNTSLQLGYTRPSQAEIRNNYFGRAYLFSYWHWGEGDISANEKAPNVFTGNEIYTTGNHIELRTSAYTAINRQEGVTPFPKTDKFDNNIFSSLFKAVLLANNTSTNLTSLAGWQSSTLAAGSAFDSNSQMVSFPTTPKVFLNLNEYDTSKIYTTVYNWGKGANVAINISGVISLGSAFQIYNAKDTFGAPLASGIYSGGSVNVPTGGAEFLVLIIDKKIFDSPKLAPAPTPTISATQTRGDLNGDGIVNSIDYSIMSRKWNQTQNITAIDINGDGVIDSKDYLVIKANWMTRQ